MEEVLSHLHAHWPQGLHVGGVFSDVPRVMDDLRLLHRAGLIELRCVDTEGAGTNVDTLNRFEAAKGGYCTTRYHTRIAAVA
jgi:hypothetical protein